MNDAPRCGVPCRLELKAWERIDMAGDEYEGLWSFSRQAKQSSFSTDSTPYSFWPHRLPDERMKLNHCPNGYYYAFMRDDFGTGTFRHLRNNVRPREHKRTHRPGAP